MNWCVRNWLTRHAFTMFNRQPRAGVGIRKPQDVGEESKKVKIFINGIWAVSGMFHRKFKRQTATEVFLTHLRRSRKNWDEQRKLKRCEIVLYAPRRYTELRILNRIVDSRLECVSPIMQSLSQGRDFGQREIECLRLTDTSVCCCVELIIVILITRMQICFVWFSAYTFVRFALRLAESILGIVVLCARWSIHSLRLFSFATLVVALDIYITHIRRAFVLYPA